MRTAPPRASRGPAAQARAAVTFLTRVPLGGDGDLARAALWFPAVGALVGALGGGVRWAAHQGLTRPVATILALAAVTIVTGALHEDALADAADGLGAHANAQRRLEIMRDPRIGAYGALAIAFALLLTYATLTPLSDVRFLRAAVTAHALARWSTLPATVLVRAAPGGTSAALVRPPRLAAAVVTALTAGGAIVVAGAAAGGVAVGAAAAVTWLGATAARRSLGGLTGDALGAVNKLVELSTYVALAAVW